MIYTILGGIFFIALMVGIFMLIKKFKSPEKHKDYCEGKMVLCIGLIGWFLITAAFSITIVGAGECKILVRFGKVRDRVLDSGVKLKDPFSATITYSLKRQLIDLQKTGEVIATSEGVRAVAKDKTTIWLDMALPFHLNMKYAPFLYENIGGEKIYKRDLLVHAARAAIKSGASEFSWEEITVTKKREFVDSVKSHFRQIVIKDLESKGLTKKEAKQVFIYHPVELRNYKLPEKLRNSINEKQAALEDLKRQKTLTKIADERALRRAKDGQGIKNMFDRLPDRDPSEIASILNAIANQRRSEALLKAVEQGRVAWGVLNGNPPVAVPAK
jgi:regulator of protease activity HflC (stomatin/prohibitin superfamily)